MDIRHENPLVPVQNVIVELRQYALHPEQREVLINLFDREFIESQEAVGIEVIGQFRDLENPDAFVWLRGFPDMEVRIRSLAAFYGGPVWSAYRDAANATMIDSDDVLLLRPARPGAAFSLENLERPPREATEISAGIVVATICEMDASADTDFLNFFDSDVAPSLTEAGASILAQFVTEKSVNTFPRLPIREGENVFVWFSGFPNRAAYERHVTDLSRSQRWNREVARALEGRVRTQKVLKLSPTARSRLRV